MNPEEIKQIKIAWLKMAAYYQAQIADYVFEMYADDISDLNAQSVLAAMQAWRRDSKNNRVPLPAQIRSIVNPQADAKDLARDTVLRIRHAISKFGWIGGPEAQKFIGQLGWDSVEKFGGWAYICQHLGYEIQESVFIAQCRDSIESSIKLQRLGFEPNRPAIEQSKESHREISSSIVSLIKSKSIPE